MVTETHGGTALFAPDLIKMSKYLFTASVSGRRRGATENGSRKAKRVEAASDAVALLLQ